MQDTLREQIGQMLIMGFVGKTLGACPEIAEAIAHHHIRGVVLFDYDLPSKQYDRNIESPEQVSQLSKELQQCAFEAAKKQEKHYEPLTIAIDYEGGQVSRLDERFGFPHTITAAECSHRPVENMKRNAKNRASTLREMGINLNFAPVIDININSDNPVIAKLQRSFSADSDEVIRLALLFAHAFDEYGITYTYKHFPGHGSSSNDSHLGLVDITNTWQEIELEPFKQLIRQSPGSYMMMPGHLVNKKLDPSGLPATLSRTMLNDVLREQLNYKGLIVSDDMQMQAMTENYGLEEALILAINAGVDLFIFANQLVDIPQSAEEIIEIIYRAIQDKKIQSERFVK